MSGRVRSEWTINLNIDCRGNDVVTKGVYDGLCFYTEAYIYDVENCIVIPYVYYGHVKLLCVEQTTVTLSKVWIGTKFDHGMAIVLR